MNRRISEVIYIKERLLFPISWLSKQDYCEYQIHLENIRGIKVRPTAAMVAGKKGHDQLYDEFKKEAVPTTFEEMLRESKKVELYSRELSVRDTNHGIYGRIDEVLMTPKEFIVIDDKPSARAFLSNIHQVYGYCLALKEYTKSQEERQMVAALRERGTGNIYWTAPFDLNAEEEILSLVNRIHLLLSGIAEFNSSDNPNKCKACRFNPFCDRILRA